MSKDRFHYSNCGLDNVYLLNGFRRSNTPHGKVVHVEDIDGLHRAIGEYLVFEKLRLNGREFRFLRHELGLSQKMLGLMLGKNVQAIARWEKSQSKIDGAAERLLRILYAEKVDGNDGVKEMLECLSKLDDLIDGELSFEDTDEGWQPYKIAA